MDRSERRRAGPERVAGDGVRDRATGPYGSLQPSTDKLLLDLSVRAAYVDDEIFFMFEWETEQPGFHHDFLVYEGGEWVVYGGEGDGSAFPLNEDRLALLIDDGSVDGFEYDGGFMTVYSHTRQMSPADVSQEEPIAVFGEDACEDISKMLPETMDDISDWRTRVSPEEIERQRNAGYFLDLWHWRAAGRSSCVGPSTSAIRRPRPCRTSACTTWPHRSTPEAPPAGGTTSACR